MALWPPLLSLSSVGGGRLLDADAGVDPPPFNWRKKGFWKHFWTLELWEEGEILRWLLLLSLEEERAIKVTTRERERERERESCHADAQWFENRRIPSHTHVVYYYVTNTNEPESPLVSQTR